MNVLQTNLFSVELFLNNYGTYLHVKDEMFTVRVKDTQSKQVTEHPPIAAHKIERIFLIKGQALSTDAVQLALKNNIDLIFLEYADGHPLGRVWHSGLGSTTRIRKRQLQASLRSEGLRWIVYWLGEKLESQADFLEGLVRHRPKQQDELQKVAAFIRQQSAEIQSVDARVVSEIDYRLRGWEGTASAAYFQMLSKLLPEAWRFERRSRRPAADSFNAFLNYAYGILYSHVEKSLMIAGLDPYVGFMHRDDYNQRSMVYDFIEPYRIYAQRVVFHLFSRKRVAQKHTSPLANGVRLNEEGKPLLVEAFNTYFREDKIRYAGRLQTRANALQQDAHQFAKALLDKKTPPL